MGQALHLKSARHAWLACGTAALALFSAQPVLAQTTEAAPQADESGNDVIVIIGTRRTDRTVADSASPIDVVGGAELTAQPAANMLDVVKNLVPSFFVPQNTISDASTFVRAPSLRGLSADQILVMVNGKRYNRSALVNVVTGSDTALSFGAQGADIANIPSIAIKNLQILRDGATAQYGSDAIAGVINYQLRDNAGIEVQGLWGQSYEGDGERKQLAGNAGLKLGDSGFINVSAEWFKEEGTSRGVTRPIAVLLAQANPSVANRIPNYPDPAQIWGSSPTEGYKLFLNAGVDLSDSAQLYLAVNYSHSKANQSFNYRSPYKAQTPLVRDSGSGPETVITNLTGPGSNGAFNTIYITPCPANNATCPAGGFVRNGGQTFNFTSIYPGGFTPRFIGKVDQFWGTGGIKGDGDSGLTYDLSATFARNSLALSMTDSLNGSFGPQSQTSFYFGKLIQEEQTVNLDLTYPLEVGWASPITLSGGLEYHREQYSTTPGDPQSYAAGPYAQQPLYDLVSPGVYTATGVTASQSPAASGYGGINPAFARSASQTNYSAYVGAEADITKAFTLGLAARYDHFNTFGDAVVGKINGIYRFSDAVSLRATVGKGFHAPSPGQSTTQIVTTAFSPGGEQVQTGTYPVDSAIAQFYGARALKPEKSTNFGGGIVITPTTKFTLTVDGYLIKIKNRIGITQTFSVTAADIAKLPALASVGAGGDIQYFTNGFDTKTTGVDVVANYRTSAMGGPLAFTFAYSYNMTTVTKFNPQVLQSTQIYDIGHISPHHRVNLGANWQIGNFTINARENYYSSWHAEQDYPGQRFGSKFVTDLDISYTIAEHYTLTVGANNLFNAYPDKIAPSASAIYALTGGTSDGQIYPRNGGPFGINGGFYYARIRISY